MIINALPVSKETLSAKEFLFLSKTNPEMIKKSYFIPAKLGSSNFGGACVESIMPVYKRS